MRMDPLAGSTAKEFTLPKPLMGEPETRVSAPVVALIVYSEIVLLELAV